MLTTNQIRKASHFSSPSRLFKWLVSLATFILPYWPLFFLRLPGSQQPQPVWHWRRPHRPLLFCDPWPGSRLGQRHHDTGEQWRVLSAVFKAVTVCLIETILLWCPTSGLCSQRCFCSLVLPHCRCPTRNPTSGRKRYWSCTRCS